MKSLEGQFDTMPRRLLAQYLTAVMTAPWKEDARESDLKDHGGSYPWQASIRKCKETDSVLVGWPLKNVWPGRPGTELKLIEPDKRKELLQKLNRDRFPSQGTRLALEYTCLFR